MARKKLAEFTAKTLLLKALDVPYMGIFVRASQTAIIDGLDAKKLYVVKVDEGVKGRMKKGLVGLKLTPGEIPNKIKDFIQKGYSQFVIEEFISHDASSERYFSIERTREGNTIYYASVGGIDIEGDQEKVKKEILTTKNVKQIAEFLGIPSGVLGKVLSFFEEQYISFLEVNPLVVEKDKFYFLDLAVEVDSTAEFFVQKGWTAKDFIESANTQQTEEEKNIIALKAKSQAAFKFDLLNPQGSIWMLLSGGGASIVLADEVYNLGKGNDLANYGEYSGNPNQEETYIYTKNLLSLLLKSKAPKKALVIGGGVANFTDIKITFKGVIKALDEVKIELAKEHVKIFVRRGGPNQDAGLFAMKEFLQSAGLLGRVVGPDVMITEIIGDALEYLK